MAPISCRSTRSQGCCGRGSRPCPGGGDRTDGGRAGSRN
ncbi:hypothetical protein UO65_2682 [Actinokineospora spheciospongiae]|uniref:Uncharacterized protein n=1 Tax=Actinokineospora spheciospongiae TaxID=909613 RepID=W7J7I2_9PSEU|nr:hypothetical protein UO65_2682 [Actinokineospora spheciospongiae]